MAEMIDSAEDLITSVKKLSTTKIIEIRLASLNWDSYMIDFTNGKNSWCFNFYPYDAIDDRNEKCNENYKIFKHFLENPNSIYYTSYSKITIENKKLIVYNLDKSDYEYYGFKTAKFDLNVLLPEFYKLFDAIENAKNFIKYEKYSCNIKDSILEFKSEINEIIFTFNKTFKCGDTYYPERNKESSMNKIGIESIVNDLKEGKEILRFKDGGEDLLHVEKIDNYYVFTTNECKRYGFQMTKDLENVFNQLIAYYEKK